jgi:cysteine desulfurase/selenocysteine lyase
MIKDVTLEDAKWNDIPWKFEAGTPNIADVIAFGKAIEYLSHIGFDALSSHERRLTELALSRLDGIEKLTIYGPKDLNGRAGIISFNIDGLHPHDVGTILDHEGVAVRAGHHCAKPLMRRLGVSATVRASFYLYNSPEEIERLILALKSAVEFFKRPSRVEV